MPIMRFQPAANHARNKLLNLNASNDLSGVGPMLVNILDLP